MLLPKGTYNARAVRWDFGTSEGGKEYVAVEFEVVHGEHAGTTRTWRGFFTDKTQQRTIESLRYCGWRTDDLMQLEGMGDTMVRIVIDHEEYEGKVRDRVQWVNRCGGPLVKNTMDDAARRAFAMRMKGLAMSVPKDLAEGPAAPEPSAPPKSTGNGHSGDEDPFPGDDDILF